MRDGVGNLLVARPDVAQIDRLAVAALAERLGGEVLADRPGKRVGDDERRRRQIIGAHLRMDAALEIAVAGEHGSDRKVARVDRVGDRLGQRAGIADAGRAAVADEVEAELVQMLLQSGRGVIVADHLAARREAGLDPGLDLEPLLHRLLGDETGGQHDARVRGVGAAGDRGNHDIAVVELVVGAFDLGRTRLVDAGKPRQFAVEPARRAGQRDPVLRPARPRQRRFDAREVEVERVGEHRLRRAGVVPQCPAPWHRPRRAGPATGSRRGQCQIADRLGVDREEAAGRPVFRRHVADRRAVGERQLGEARVRKTRRTCRPRRACAASG